jgi:RNA polymerase sigma factor (TIGR02999 family)
MCDEPVEGPAPGPLDDPATAGEITALLRSWSAGDEGALARLAPRVYRELRAIAGRQARGERAGSTLTPTAVVHELYLRLAGQERARWQNRRQFFAVAARLMRRILVDHARERGAEKRGGAALRVELTEELALAAPAGLDVLALDRALERLAALDRRQAAIVELRCFAGLSVEETAEIVGISTPTVKRDLRSARAFLLRELAS